MLLINLVLLPFRVAWGTTKLAYKTGRFVGYRRLAVFGIGVGVGLLIAPTPGRQLRARIRTLLEQRRPVRLSDPELGERVRVELRHSARTWHLPQPEVVVESGQVVLRGSVPHETARVELERAAAAVPGVAAVLNDLVVAGSNGHS